MEMGRIYLACIGCSIILIVLSLIDQANCV